LPGYACVSAMSRGRDNDVPSPWRAEPAERRTSRARVVTSSMNSSNINRLPRQAPGSGCASKFGGDSANPYIFGAPSRRRVGRYVRVYPIGARMSCAESCSPPALRSWLGRRSLYRRARPRNVGGHCPTNNAELRRPVRNKSAETTTDAIARVQYACVGIASIKRITRSATLVQHISVLHNCPPFCPRRRPAGRGYSTRQAPCQDTGLEAALDTCK